MEPCGTTFRYRHDPRVYRALIPKSGSTRFQGSIGSPQRGAVMTSTNTDLADPTPARQPTRCLGCGATIARATVRTEGRRLRRLGFGGDMIEHAMPRCGPCVRRWQRESFFGRIWTMASRGMMKMKQKAVVPRVGGALRATGTLGRTPAHGAHDRPRSTPTQTAGYSEGVPEGSEPGVGDSESPVPGFAGGEGAGVRSIRDGSLQPGGERGR